MTAASLPRSVPGSGYHLNNILVKLREVDDDSEDNLREDSRKMERH